VSGRLSAGVSGRRRALLFRTCLGWRSVSAYDGLGLGSVGHPVRKIAVLLACAGLLAACSSAPRGPAAESLGFPKPGAVGNAPGGPAVTSAPSLPKSSAAKTALTSKAKSASNRKGRSAAHPKAPKRVAERPAIQNTAAAAKAPDIDRPHRPAPEIPLD